MHESKMHRYNSYLTLTIDDNHLSDRYWTGQLRPDGTRAYAGNLDYRPVQLMLKRLRKALCKGNYPTLLYERPRHGSADVRYYLAGEYGEQYLRPHWHICLFGVDFTDKVYETSNKNGDKLYSSKTLQKLWPLGFSTIGDVTFQSAAYVARYVMKKITGKKQKQHYEKIDIETGEIINLRPEFNNMSRGRGIGHTFMQKYLTDMYPEGHVYVRGTKQRTPRYYDKQYEKTNPVEYEKLQLDRHEYARTHLQDHTPKRLAAREAITKAKLTMLKRQL